MLIVSILICGQEYKVSRDDQAGWNNSMWEFRIWLGRGFWFDDKLQWTVRICLPLQLKFSLRNYLAMSNNSYDLFFLSRNPAVAFKFPANICFIVSENLTALYGGL